MCKQTILKHNNKGGYMEQIYNELCEKLGKENVYQNEPMKNYTSFKIGGNADFLVKANSEEALITK